LVLAFVFGGVGLAHPAALTPHTALRQASSPPGAAREGEGTKSAAGREPARPNNRPLALLLQPHLLLPLPLRLSLYRLPLLPPWWPTRRPAASAWRSRAPGSAAASASRPAGRPRSASPGASGQPTSWA